MSNAVLTACWPLQMLPTPKAVLISLADNANEQGACWPSIPKIMERTCLGERTVHGAIKWLEQHGAISADRSNGRHTRYRVTPDTYEPPQELRPRSTRTRAGMAGEPPQQRRPPPHGLRPNHQEPPVPLNALSGARVATCSPGEAAAALNRAGARITSQHPDLIAACAEGVTAAQLLELRDAHPGKPAPYLVAIARRHVAENANAATPGTTPNAPNRHLSAVDRIAANIERAHQHHDEPRTGSVLEGHAIRIAR